MPPDRQVQTRGGMGIRITPDIEKIGVKGGFSGKKSTSDKTLVDKNPIEIKSGQNTKEDPMQNHSYVETTLILRRGAMQNKDGQVGELISSSGFNIAWILEDVNRLPELLDDRSNFDDIAWLCNPSNPDAKKVYGKTAIPAGLYKIGTRHDRGRAEDERRRYFNDGDWHSHGIMELIDVPGFKYIQMHPGNWPKDTRGCPLVGNWDKRSLALRSSRIYYKPFYETYAPIAAAGKLWIRIIDADNR